MVPRNCDALRITVKTRQNSQTVIADLIRNPAAPLDSGYEHAGMTGRGALTPLASGSVVALHRLVLR
jgi:hypothetical protein